MPESLNDMMGRWEFNRKKQFDESVAALKTSLAKMHAALKLTEDSVINYSWNGSGDSGDLYYESCDFKSTEKDIVIVDTSEMYIEDVWDIKQSDIYNLMPGGWEINEGSVGDIKLYPATGKIIVSPAWLEYVEGNEDVY